MNTLTVAAILFILTAILHLVTPLRFRNQLGTWSIAGFGVIYLVLGILLLLTSLGWLPIVALIIVMIGGIGAVVGINANPALRSLKLFMIAIDLVIIGLLVFHMVGGG